MRRKTQNGGYLYHIETMTEDVGHSVVADDGKPLGLEFVKDLKIVVRTHHQWRCGTIGADEA